MPGHAFLTFFDKAHGESTVKGKERWVEVVQWGWDIAAASTWTRGGGASVGKPAPGKFVWQHSFDLSSPVIMGSICTGKAFPKVELQMVRTNGAGRPETYFTMTMEGAFTTKVSTSGTADGGIVQEVEMIYKKVKIDYRLQDATGGPGTVTTFQWDVPAGTASPSP
jgi:type VI secretion system Hcp family effector